MDFPKEKLPYHFKRHGTKGVYGWLDLLFFSTPFQKKIYIISTYHLIIHIKKNRHIHFILKWIELTYATL
jgi:hypothetical protein